MKRTLSLLLALLLALSLAACSKTSPTQLPDAPEAPSDPQSVEPPPGDVLEPEAEPTQEPASAASSTYTPLPALEKASVSRDGSDAVYTCTALKIPVPQEYRELMRIDTEFEFADVDPHRQPLIGFFEQASVDAGQLEHPGEDWGDGWLCDVVRLDQVGFEALISHDIGGSQLFARDGTGYYYLLTVPTDVRFTRPGDDPTADTAGLKQWGALCNWAYELLPEAILDANPDLESYTAEEFGNGAFIYPGEHIIYSYRDEFSDDSQLTLLYLAQPVRQGEGGIWCVERFDTIYLDYASSDTVYCFPAANEIDEPAAGYYARLQDECDAGEHPELLQPISAAIAFSETPLWNYISMETPTAENFTPYEAAG